MAPPAFVTYLRPRVRLVGVASAVGVGVGILSFVALLAYAGDAGFAGRKSFALGALALSIGLLGWSGSAMAGESIEAMQRYMDVHTGWTEADSRRAMARVGGFGAGWMVGSSVAAALA